MDKEQKIKVLETWKEELEKEIGETDRLISEKKERREELILKTEAVILAKRYFSEIQQQNFWEKYGEPLVQESENLNQQIKNQEAGELYIKLRELKNLLSGLNEKIDLLK